MEIVLLSAACELRPGNPTAKSTGGQLQYQTYSQKVTKVHAHSSVSILHEGFLFGPLL